MSNSINVLLNSTGLSDLTYEPNYTIYPNPCYGEFRVSFINGEFNIDVYDITGRSVFQLEGNAKAGKLETVKSPVLEKGIYIIAITNSGKSNSSKIVIE